MRQAVFFTLGMMFFAFLTGCTSKEEFIVSYHCEKIGPGGMIIEGDQVKTYETIEDIDRIIKWFEEESGHPVRHSEVVVEVWTTVEWMPNDQMYFSVYLLDGERCVTAYWGSHYFVEKRKEILL